MGIRGKRKPAHCTEYTKKAREAIYRRDGDACFFCLRGYHPAPQGMCGAREVMHIVPRSRMGMGVEQNGVCGCSWHHAMMDNGNRGLGPEMVGMLEEYMRGMYPGWTRESVTYKKYGWMDPAKGSRHGQGQENATGGRAEPGDGFSWLEGVGE